MPPERFGARSRRLLVWLYIAASSSLPLLPWRPPFDDAYPPVPEAPLDVLEPESDPLPGAAGEPQWPSIADLGGERSEVGGVLERSKRQSDVQAERMQNAVDRAMQQQPPKEMKDMGDVVQQVMAPPKPPKDTAGRVYKNIIDATATGGDEQRSGRLDFCEAFGESVIDNECVGRVLDE